MHDGPWTSRRALEEYTDRRLLAKTDNGENAFVDELAHGPSTSRISFASSERRTRTQHTKHEPTTSRTHTPNPYSRMDDAPIFHSCFILVLAQRYTYRTSLCGRTTTDISSDAPFSSLCIPVSYIVYICMNVECAVIPPSERGGLLFIQ